MKFLFIALFSIISVTSVGQTWQKMELEYINSSSINEQMKIAEKMLVYSLKNHGDTSFFYMKSNYYTAQYYIEKENYPLYVKYLELAINYYINSDNQKCGFYHQILYELIHGYNNLSNFEKTFETSLLLISCEKIKNNECYVFDNKLGGSKQFLIGRLIGEACLNIKGKEEKGIELLTSLLDRGIHYLNYDTNNVKTNLNKEYVLQNVLITEETLSNYYTNRYEYSKVIKTIDFVNKINPEILEPKYVYQSLALKSKFENLLGQDEAFSKTINNQILLLQSGKIYPLDSREFYFEIGLMYRKLKNDKEAVKFYEEGMRMKSINSDKYSEDEENLYLYSYYSILGNNKLAGEYLKKLNNKEIIKGNQYNLLLGNKLEKEGNDSLAIEQYNEIIFNNSINNSFYLEALKFKNYILSKKRFNSQTKYNEYAKSTKLEFEYNLKSIDRIIFSLSNSERESFLKINDYKFNHYIMESTFLRSQTMSEIAFNTSLYFKNILLESNRKINKIIYTDNVLKQQYDNLISLKKELATTYLNEESKNTSYNQSKISKIDSLESILMRNFPDIKTVSDKKNYSFKDIQENLKQGECAIEFSYYNDHKNNYYLALIATSSTTSPRVIELCSKNQLDSVYAIINENYSSDNYRDRTFELNSHYYKLLWQPIEKYLSDVKTIYYSPIDELNNFSFSTFVVNSNDTTYLMDKYNLESVLSTASIISNKNLVINNSDSSIVLFGGVEYNFEQKISSDLALADNRELNKSIRGSYNKNNQRNKVSSLPFTKTEVDDISNLLSKNKWAVNKEFGKEATENKIKKLEVKKSPTILHFATHGFSFPEADNNYEGAINIFESSDNSMQRSGLLFYASNDSWNGKRDTVIKYTGEDGVLTADEVSNLDLSNTKLVVMSACQSGLGAIKGTEGVYGLKRAFRLAGVENMIVSLWPVPDKETMELMNLFYSELVKSNDISLSFHNAQKTMRNKYPNNPWAWGGFVLVR